MEELFAYALLYSEGFDVWSLYADDCLSYHDEEQCRQLYEKAMHYYD